MKLNIQFLFGYKFTFIYVNRDNLRFSSEKLSFITRDTLTQSRTETQYKICILYSKVTRAITNQTSLTNIIITQITTKKTHNIWDFMTFQKLSKFFLSFLKMNAISGEYNRS